MPKDLTQEYIKEVLDYNPETGIFIVKKPLPHRPQHRNRQAGRIAGTVNDQGYVILMIDKKRYRAHQIAWVYMNGHWPKNLIDHIDGNPRNNKFSNLREATAMENSHNMKIRSNNKSGLKGVAYYPNVRSPKKWRAKIKFNYKDIVLGNFDCPAAAHFAYVIAADKIHGEFARFS